MDPKGLTAVVTGGASGLGRATAEALAAAGAVVGVLDRDGERAKEVADIIQGVALPADVTDYDAVAAAWRPFADRHGPVRILVNCAGVGKPERLVDRKGAVFSLENFRRIVDINLMGAVVTMRVALEGLNKDADALNADGERGVFVNTASVAAYDGQAGQVSYSGAKGAIAAMTLPAARDLARLGIRVMCLAPGIFDTPILSALRDDIREAIADGVPFPRRLGHASEYADLVMTIIRTTMLNGEVIRIDGGLRLQ